MAIDADKAVFFCFLNEIFFLIGRRKVESNVHTASVFFYGMPFIKSVAFVDDVVNQFCFFLVSFFNDIQSALFYYPVEHLVQCVNAEYRRRIVGGIFFNKCFVLKERGDIGTRRFCKILFKNDKSHTGGTQVFLYACPNHVEAVEIYAAGKDIRGHVTNDRDIYFRKFPIFRAINRIVCCNVEIICFRLYQAVFGNVGIVSIFGGVCIIYFSEERSGITSFVCPHAGICVSGAGVEEIITFHKELHGAATLNEYDFMIRCKLHEIEKQ